MSHVFKLTDQTRYDLSSLASVDPTLIKYALGKALSDQMAVPSSPIENIEEYFKNSAQTSNFEIMCVISELVPLDYEDMDQYIRMFWKLRYSLVHDTLMKLSRENNAFDFFGIAHQLSIEQLTFINEHSVDLCRIYNKFINIINNINSAIINYRK